MKFVFKPEYKVLPAGCDSQFHVITSLSVPSDTNGIELRPPISLALVIDCSGSMEGAKIEQTKNAILEVMHTLTRRDRLTIVTFDDDIHTIYELSLLQNKQTVTEIVSQISTAGSTNLSGGWLKALSQLAESFDPSHINRIFLLTDGQANRGVTDPAELVKIGRTYREKGIPTSTFGFGSGFNETLLKDIASNSGGNFYFAEKPEDISTAFSCEFGEVSDLAGQNCEVTFTLPDGVELIEDLSSFELSRKHQILRYNIGDITPELDHDIIFRIKTSAAFNNGTPALFKVLGSYTSVGGEYNTITAESQLKIEFSENSNCAEVDEDVVDSVILARCMKAKHRAYVEATAGRKDSALSIIHERETVILERLECSMLADRDRLNLELEMLGKIKQSLNLAPADSGKTIKSQIEEFAKKRGAYLQTRKEKKYIINTEVQARDTTRQEEICRNLAGALTDLGLETDFMRRCQVCFSELLSNSTEHGCKGITGGQTKIMGVFRRGSAIIQFSDPGKGFDYDAALEKAKNVLIPTAETENRNTDERGRGIALILAHADEVLYSNGGSEVQVKLTNKAKEGVITFDSSSVGDANAVSSNKLSVEVKNHQCGNNLVVEVLVSGDMDMFSNPHIKTVFQGLRDKGVCNIVLNMRKLNYFDSSGLGLLVYLYQLFFRAGGKLVAIEVNDYCFGVISQIQLQHIIEICDNLDDALKLFAS